MWTPAAYPISITAVQLVGGDTSRWVTTLSGTNRIGALGVRMVYQATDVTTAPPSLTTETATTTATTTTTPETLPETSTTLQTDSPTNLQLLAPLIPNLTGVMKPSHSQEHSISSAAINGSAAALAIIVALVAFFVFLRILRREILDAA